MSLQRLCHDEFVWLDSTIIIDDSREVLCFTRVLFRQQASNLPEGRETLCQNYIEGLVLEQTNYTLSSNSDTCKFRDN